MNRTSLTLRIKIAKRSPTVILNFEVLILLYSTFLTKVLLLSLRKRLTVNVLLILCLSRVS